MDTLSTPLPNAKRTALALSVAKCALRTGALATGVRRPVKTSMRSARVKGSSPHGQGMETTFAQIVADELGLPFDDVEVVYGDTAVVPQGSGTRASRSLVVVILGMERSRPLVYSWRGL